MMAVKMAIKTMLMTTMVTLDNGDDKSANDDDGDDNDDNDNDGDN